MSRSRDLVVVVILALLLVLLLCCIFIKKSAPAYQPSREVYKGSDVVVLEDFVVVEEGRYVVRAAVPERFTQIPIWGGWSLSGNITYSPLVVNLTDFTVLVFGVASKNATLDQDLGNYFRVRATAEGGYVTYNGTLAGWCLRQPVYRNNTYVWLPASECSLDVKYRITVEPAWGGVFVNGKPAEVVNVKLKKVEGVLPGWVVYANSSGTYYLTARP